MGHFDGKADAYKAGWVANCDGVSARNNPYEENSSEYDDWADGWLESFENSDDM